MEYGLIGRPDLDFVASMFYSVISLFLFTLCVCTTHTNLNFLLINPFIGRSSSDFKYWFQCHQQSTLILNINFLIQFRAAVLTCTYRGDTHPVPTARHIFLFKFIYCITVCLFYFFIRNLISWIITKMSF